MSYRSYLVIYEIQIPLNFEESAVVRNFGFVHIELHHIGFCLLEIFNRLVHNCCNPRVKMRTNRHNNEEFSHSRELQWMSAAKIKLTETREGMNKTMKLQYKNKGTHPGFEILLFAQQCLSGRCSFLMKNWLHSKGFKKTKAENVRL